jgi:tetratricopeptide (TPR) repeat protein
MKNKISVSVKLCLFLLLGIFVAGAGSAYGQSSEKQSAKEKRQIEREKRQAERATRDKQKTKQAQAVSKAVYDKITAAQEKVEAEDYNGALRDLQILNNNPKLTEYEKSNVLNYIGFVYYNMGNITGAITTYVEMLRIASLEEQIRKQTVYTLAQLYTMEEQYINAIRLLEEWFTLELNPRSDPYILYAQNLYQVNRFQDMIKPIETAIQISIEREKPVKEDWYVLLNFAYFQQEDYRKVRDIQKILLANWPKKRYWFSLAGAYTELEEENNLFASYDASHTQGLLEKESEIVTMAQLLMQHEVPYKAGILLEMEMEKGIVTRNAKNYRLLSQAWSVAQEDEKSIPALKEAARLSNEGELNLRLGNAYLNLGQYPACVSAIQEGLKKGGIKSPDNAHISLGMCLYSQQKYSSSKNAFSEARKTKRSRKISNQWINVINNEIERNEQVAAIEAAAQKQIQELAKRRKASGRT